MHSTVFISYARRDYKNEQNQVILGNVVSRIQNALCDAGITYWMDDEELIAGETFPTRIAEQIKACEVFLFISTEQSNQSEWIINEIATAHHYHKVIIPFRYDNSAYNTGLMIYLASLQYIDYSADPNNAIPYLIYAIQQALGDSNAASMLPTANPKAAIKHRWHWWHFVLIALAVCCSALSAYLLIHNNNVSHADTITEQLVYITPHGECFHKDSTCHTIRHHNIQAITYDQALQLSRRPCTYCIDQ